MVDIISRVIKKIVILIYKIVNFRLFKNGVILFGIPQLIKRGNIIFEKGVRINEKVFIHGAGGVTVGENTTLSHGVSIISTGYDINNWDTNKILKEHKDEQVILGKNIWICANVTILPGVSINDDIIVAAGSVVTKNLLESGYIYGGVPAKKLKKIEG